MIDPRFIVNLKGRDFPTWPGILDAATRAGLRSLTTTVIQIPTPENGPMAVVMARAEFEDGRAFEDVGDASPANCSPQIAAAALRMASTRAKGRCLRDAVNVGQTMYEELPEEKRTGFRSFQPAEAAGVAPEAPRNGQKPPTEPRACEECGKPLTASQATLSLRKHGQPLCHQHQKTAAVPA